jgi:hypothetical protein
MNGVVIESMANLEEACEADAVIVGSGIATRSDGSWTKSPAPG